MYAGGVPPHQLVDKRVNYVHLLYPREQFVSRSSKINNQQKLQLLNLNKH
jgi:hypothetical protein